MTKTKQVVIGIILALIIIIAIGIYFSEKEEVKFFNKVQISSNNYVLNRSDMKYLDTIILVGLDELKIKGVLILVREITIKNNSELKLKAHIVGGSSQQYLIEVDNSFKSDIISSISHELIHLKQMEDGRLINTPNYLIWEKDTLSTNIPEYDERPWEVEARGLGKLLEIRVKNLLYE